MPKWAALKRCLAPSGSNPGQIRPAPGHACPLQSISVGFKSLLTSQPPLSGVNRLRRFQSRRRYGSTIGTQLNGQFKGHKAFLIQGQIEGVQPVLMLYHHHAERPSEFYYAVWCECQLTRASCFTQTAAVVGRTPDNVSLSIKFLSFWPFNRFILFTW